MEPHQIHWGGSETVTTVEQLDALLDRLQAQALDTRPMLVLIGGPAGVVTGAAIGAATGGVAANMIDMGFPDDFLEGIEKHIKHDSSALIVLINKEWSEKLGSILEQHNGIQYNQALTDEMVAKFLEEKEE